MYFKPRCNFSERDCYIIHRPFPWDVKEERRFLCVTHFTYHICNGGKSCLPIGTNNDETFYCTKTKLPLLDVSLNEPHIVKESRLDREQDQLLNVLRNTLQNTVTKSFTDDEILRMHRMLTKIQPQFANTVDYETLTRLLVYTLGAICVVPHRHMKKNIIIQTSRKNKKTNTIRTNKRCQTLYRILKIILYSFWK